MTGDNDKQTTPEPDIPVLETPATDMVNDQLLEELDIPILTTPVEDTDAPKADHKPI